MNNYNQLPKTQAEQLRRDMAAVRHQALRAAKNRVAEAARRAYNDIEIKFEDFTAVVVYFHTESEAKKLRSALDDLRRLKGEG